MGTAGVSPQSPSHKPTSPAAFCVSDGGGVASENPLPFLRLSTGLSWLVGHPGQPTAAPVLPAWYSGRVYSSNCFKSYTEVKILFITLTTSTLCQ